MRRPVGVLILAVLDFLGAIFLTVFGLIVRLRAFQILGLWMRFAILSPVGQAGIALLVPIQNALMKVFGWGSLFIILAANVLLPLVFAAICGVAGYGMLRLKGWARIANIVFAILGLASPLFRFFWSQQMARNHPETSVSFFFIGVRVCMNGLILWYLMRPQVRAAFANQSKVARGVTKIKLRCAWDYLTQ